MVEWKNYIDFIVNKGDIEDCMIVSSDDGHVWAATPDFDLREYLALVVIEDGSEVEESINEASNLLILMNRSKKPSQGLRLNGGKKQQLIREFIDSDTNNFVVCGKTVKGGSCIANAGKCILIGTFNENKGHTSSGCIEVITLMAKHLSIAPWPDDIDNPDDLDHKFSKYSNIDDNTPPVDDLSTPNNNQKITSRDRDSISPSQHYDEISRLLKKRNSNANLSST